MKNTYYLAPGSKEYTLTAGKLANLDENSQILDIACGHGIASINLAKKFCCHATAIDINKDFIEVGKKLAAKEKCVHNKPILDKVKFVVGDIYKKSFPKNKFDMLVAEGGALSYIGREKGIKKISKYLKKGGYIELSDMIINNKKLPKEFKELFTQEGWNFETEESYKKLLRENGYDPIFSSFIPRSYMLNYAKAIKAKLKRKEGAFKNKKLQSLLNEELAIFYSKDEWLNNLAYIFIVAKKIK